MTFVAVIFAYTEFVFSKLNGAAEKTDLGIVQLLFATAVELEPSQLVSSSAYDPSTFWK
ncbi:MAG: hypothetical protein NZ777_18240 [Pseudomonadales bacterium]|nr:hypothetical protein [Pseudomonadales bacterium]